MGLSRMGPPEALLLALKERLGVDDFVETGTYRGDTTAWAAKHFPRVTTVELSSHYHAAAAARFVGQAGVRALCGESSAILREVIHALNGPALFWLDAHWSGMDTAGRKSECPLLNEIALINEAAPAHAVMVDDARLFCAPPPRPHQAEQWPDLSTTVLALWNGGRRHIVITEDVFVAVPIEQRDFLNGWLRDNPRISTSQGSSRTARWWKRLRA